MHRPHFHMFFGRHRGHPPGFGRFGGGFMAGDMGGRGFGMGRKLSSADLQMLILKLLDERPSYGYEIIKELEQRSKGFYVPSPGMVYPAMTYLEEIGHATVEIDGARKLYAITEAGQEHLRNNSATVEALLTQFGRIGERMERLRRAFNAGESEEGMEPGHGALKELKYAMHALREALHDRWGSSRDEQQRIAEVLKRAADEIKSGGA
jgi:DNA-binding PadR family transcriptional regulator